VKSLHLPATDTLDHRALRHVLSTLAATGVIPNATRPLDMSKKDAGNALRKVVLAEVPAFSNSGNPEILPGLSAHIEEHLQELRRLFGGGEVGDFAFLRSHAHRRAEQRFPLEASLHAYRCAHKILALWLRDAAVASRPRSIETAVSAVADFAIEYTNTVSSIITAEYISHTRAIADAESDRRSELLNILLSGYDESDGRAGRLLKRAGYLEQRQTYCVAVAQSANPTEMELPDRAQRISNAITTTVSASPIRVLTGIRNNVVTAVLSDIRRQSGWTAPQTKLAERLRSLLLNLGPAVIVGTSSDQPSTAFLPRALQEAMIALDFASVGKRVVQFSDLPIRSLMLHRGGDYVRTVAPAWVSALIDADARAKGSLVRTLQVLADADMNVQKAGRKLGIHPNTIYARLDRIKVLTGLDGQRHHHLVELLLAADCWQA
jgi:PucR C-terminal helix-turn-helix domain/GGDEF-like domain